MVGNEAQREFLHRAWEKGNLSHAYLFVGAVGSGTREMTKELLGWFKKGKISLEDGGGAEWLLVKREIDLKSGKKHKDISIDGVRKIRDYLNHFSLVGGRQIVVVDEAEFLSKGAANALLKTLEEPRAKEALLILLTSDESLLLPTIKSRCQIIRFLPVATKTIYQSLLKEGVDQKKALEIAGLSFNRPAKAENLLIDIATYDFYKTEAERFLKSLKGTLKERWRILESFFKDKEDHIEARDNLINILDIWLSFWRDLFLLKLDNKEDLIKNISFLPDLRAQSGKRKIGEIREIIKKIEEAQVMLRQNIHPRLILENLILFYY
ncbi:MAG: polymerase III, delta prime subunit protein [Candidatus Magasanikbacteria bacterium GW2011_GWC2_40_17]|uniref:Polymerase III, delta prime subunit protein n=1 Tax=Candidatus Magasanikbacteria bacterium GW2011_GWA2_42_32 TaxID=1619039 RepID=A0A0G1CE41_9BACT|nr:MAG: polymerase III, delta prime subunit protein [Candidatus Magasanikbacteria bacterium GW2011_GWC2_40_17]KKS56961.1 MAG: polymerase III, delta prime subunit protein [Candidatus Magasanikbacteria bacterium GW2011_GWA2_42_32]OGH85691.1 MAG: hypothetical protein A2294_03630 [Candidatus Magasanikbacteria bacterium RIFOXYB2_FULL_38_10]